MKILLFIFLSALIISADFSKEIEYGYGECLKIKQTESNVEISQKKIDLYESIIDFMPIQTPINKLVSGNTDIFISLLLIKNPDDLLSFIEKEKSLKIIRKDKKRSSLAIMIKNEKMIANILIYEKSDINFMLVRLFTNDKEANLDFSNQEYYERIEC